MLTLAQDDRQPVSARGELVYRIVKIPADQVEMFTRDRPYLPMKRSEFERLVKTIRSAADGDAPAGARVKEALYRARLAGDQLVNGTATLRIQGVPTEAALLSLEGMNLAVEEVEPPNGDGQAFISSTEEGRTVAMLQGTSELQFGWSKRGEANAVGVIAFDIALPPSPRNTLTLDLPVGTTLSASHGVVSNGKTVSVTPPGRGDAVEMSRFTVQLGGRRSVELRVAPVSFRSRKTRRVLLTQTTTWEISDRGAEFFTEFQLDVRHQSLSQLTLHVAPQLRLSTVRLGDADVRIAETGQAKFVCQLPEAILGSQQVLRIRGHGPLSIGEAVKLPSLRIDGTHWQEGSIRLNVSPPLQLRRVVPGNCRQTRVDSLPDAPGGESLQFQTFGPDAFIDVVAAPAEADVSVQSATRVNLSPGGITGRCDARLKASAGERFTVRAAISPGWSIDGVQLPAATDDTVSGGQSLQGWEVHRHNGRSMLEIRLQRALAPGRPVRIVVRGRRPGVAVGEPLPVSALRLIQPTGGRRIFARLALAGSDPLRLRLSPEGSSSRISAAQYMADLRDVPPPPEGAVLLEDTPAVGKASVWLEREAARFRVQLNVTATIDQGELVEEFRIACRGLSAPTDRIIVHLATRRNDSVFWEFEAATSTGTPRWLDARRAAESDPLRIGLPAHLEVWEVRLPRPTSGDFAIRGVRTSAMNGGPVTIGPISVPAAQQEAGLIEIRSDRSDLVIDSPTLDSMPPALQDSSHRQLGLFRFDPARHVLADESGVTIRVRGDDHAPPAAWAWRLDLETQLSAAGVQSHRAVYRVQNRGRRQLKATLPRGVTAATIQLDDRTIYQRKAVEGRELTVPVDPNRRFAKLCISYRTRSGGFGLWGSVRIEPPQLDIPVLFARSRGRLPQGYQLSESSRSIDSWRPQQSHAGLFGLPARRGERAEIGDDSGIALLQALGTLARRPSEGYTWGDLLRDYAAARRRGTSSLDLPPLWIDAVALAEVGVQPSTVVGQIDAATPLSRGAELLAHSDIVVLVESHSVVLTTASAAAGRGITAVAAALQATDPADHEVLAGLVWVPTEATRAEKDPPTGSEAKAATGVSAGMLPARNWSQWYRAPGGPWESDRREAGADFPAGPDFVVTFDGTGPIVLETYHVSGMRLTGWLAGIAAALVLVWLMAVRGRWAIPASGALLAAAILLPADWLPVSTALWLAVLAAVALRLLGLDPRKWSWPIDKFPGRSRSRRIAAWGAAAGVVTLVLLVALTAPRVRADDEGKSASADRSDSGAKSFRVYDPVDENGEPHGEYLFVPKPLWEMLHTRAQRVRQISQRWLLRGAVYTGTLNWQAAASRLDFSEITARFTVQTLQPRVNVRLPFDARQIVLVDDGTQVDGAKVSPAVSSDGSRLSFLIEEVGSHAIDLIFRIPARDADVRRRLTLQVPRTPQAKLLLRMPDDSPDISTPTALGGRIRDEDLGGTVVSLGPADRLAVTWNEGAPAVAAAQEFAAKELYLLRIEPGAVAIDALLRVQGQAKERIRRLRLVVDPRVVFRLSPGQDVRVEREETGDVKVIHLVAEGTPTETLTVRANLSLPGVYGVGNVSLPLIQVLDAQERTRRLGLRVDSRLIAASAVGQGLKKTSPAEFREPWRRLTSAEAPPVDRAYELSSRDLLGGEQVIWSVRTLPASPQSTATTRQQVTFSSPQTDLQFEARIETVQGYLFRHELQVPAELQIDDVEVLDRDGAGRLLRWTRDERGMLTTFLSGPTGKEQSPYVLRLRASITAAEEGTFTVPAVRLSGVDVQRTRFELRRRQDTRVDQIYSQGWRRLDPEADSTKTGTSIVGRFERPGSGRDLQVTLSPNRPQLGGVQLLRLAPAGDRWRFEVDTRLELQVGIVDQLVFDLSSPLDEVTTDPSWQVTTSSRPGDERGQRITLTPPRAIGGDYRVRFSGVLPIRERSVSLPQVRLLSAGDLTQYVLLPARDESKRFSWNITGMSEAPLPLRLRDESFESASQLVFRVRQSPYRAKATSVRPLAGIPQVRLADVRARVAADGRFFAAASFDVVPAGAHSLRLQMPRDCTVIYAGVEGNAALCRPLDAQHWRVLLWHNNLTQRIEVVYRGRVDPGQGERRRLPAPVIADWNVEHTLWTVYGDEQRWQGVASSPLAALARRRLSATRDVVDTHVSLAAGSSGLPPRRTLAPWIDRYRTARRELLNLPPVDGDTPVARREVEAHDRTVRPVAERLKMNLAAAETRHVGVGETWSAVMQLEPRVVTAITQGQTPALLLRPRPPAAVDFWNRLMLALSVAAFSVAVYLAAERVSFAPLLTRLACPLLAVAGLLWIALLSPAIVGWLLLAVALWRSLVPAWKTHHEDDGSAILLHDLEAPAED